MASTGIIYRLVAQDSASRTFDRVGRSASATDKVFGKLARTAKMAGEAMAVGLAAGIAESTKKSAEFQAAMTRISTQAGGTAKDVQTLSKQVLDLGTKSQQGPQKLAESLYHLKSVGMGNVQAMKALKESSDLAAVGHANLEETTNALAGAWRTGIKGATSFHEAVSTVNAIIGAGNMSMDQFNAAIGTGILPSAKTFGLSMKQVGAALALMTDEGIDSASAATRLRMSFSLLGAPSKAAEKQLGKIGLTGLQLADAMRGPDGLIGAIQLLKDHLDKSGMSASEQSQILSRAFGGGRSSSGILLMINNLDVLKKKQDQVNRSTGKFDDAVKMQRKTAEAQWHLLVSNLEVMSVRIGTKVLPPVTSFVHFLASDAMPAAGRFGRVMGSIIPVDKIKSGFGEAKAAVSDFFAGLGGQKAPKPSTPMMKAPGLAPPKMPALPKSDATKLGEQIRGAFSGGIRGINWSKLGGGIGEGLVKAIEGGVKLAGKLAAAFGKVLGGIDWVGIGIALGKVVPALLLGLATGIINFDFGGLLKGLGKHWQDILLAVLSVAFLPAKWLGTIGKFLERIPFVGKLLSWAFNAFAKFSKGLVKGVGKVLRFLGDAFMTGFRRVFPEVGKGLMEALELLPTRLGVWAIELYEWGGRAIRGLGKGILKGVGWVVSKVGEVIGYILKPFARAGSWLVGKGRAVVSGLKNGVIGVAKSVGRWTRDTVVRPVTGAFARAGSWLLSKGKSLVIGLKDGVVSIARSIGTWTRDHMVRPVTGAFSRAGSWLVSKGRDLVVGLKNGVVGIAKTIGTWTRDHMVRPVIHIFTGAGSWLKNAGGHLLSGLKDGIVGAIKGIGHWIKSHLIDPVVNAVKHFFGIHSPSRVFMGIGGHLVSGLIKGMSKTSGTAIAKKVFGSLPKALSAIVGKGLVSLSGLSTKASKALGTLGLDLLSGSLPSKSSGSAQKYAKLAVAAHGWGADQWPALRALWNGESGWNYRARNPSSGAYGIPQALPASKMASAGSDWKTNAATQIKWGLSYIASRYGNPANAYAKWLSRSPHWYAKGTAGAAPGLAWVGEKGPELVNFKGGEDVLSHPQSMQFAKANGIKLPGYASGTLSNAADRVRRDHQHVEDAKDNLARAKRRHKGVAAAEKRLEAAKKELKAAEISLAQARRSAKVSISNTLSTGFLKKLETGTSSAIASAIKSITTKLLNAGYDKLAKSVMKTGEKLEKIAGKRASVQKQIAAANQYASDQAGNIRDFLSISGTSATSAKDLIGQMQGQQKTASGFVKEVGSLKARGASKALLQQLSDAGPGSQLATILGDRMVTTNDIKKLNDLVASGGKLATSFGRSMADMMYDSGKQAGKGFLTGLKAQEKDLQKELNKLASGLVKTIKKKLKIKSPSGVFRDEIGKQVVLGMAHGIDAHSHLVGSAAQRMADTATGVSTRRRYVPTAASGRSTAQEDARWERLAAAIEAGGQEVHVHFRDDRLRDLIDTQVKPRIKASEDRQAYRAKVGRRTG